MQTTCPRSVDVAVIGLGAAGSAALGPLARAGAKVVGIDRFRPPHDQGSSHGETRMLRTAYSEGPAYVPMVRRSIELWRALEVRIGQSLFHQTGVAYFGPRASPFLDSARESARVWRVPLDDLDPAQDRLAVPAGWQRLLDREGGFLDAEASIDAFLRDAESHGAAILNDCRCEGFDFTSDAVVVETSIGPISAQKIVVTAGAWASALLPALASVTHVERRVLHWFRDVEDRYSAESGFRPFLVETEDNAAFYGFPANTRGEVKLAEHFIQEKIVSPDALDRSTSQRDIDFIRPFASRFLRGLGDHVRSSVCMYPMSKDEHFIIDRHPRERRLVIGAGLSGHGFKFAPVIGEAVAHLALDAAPAIDVEFFSLRRFAEFR